MGVESPSRIFLSASAIVSVALLAACGGDSAGGGDVDAFCEEYARAPADGDAETEVDTAVLLAELERVGDLAPAEIRDDFDIMIDTFAEFMEIEAATETGEAEEMGAAFELFSDPAFITAGENIDQFGEDECGIEPSSDGDSSDDVELGHVTDDASGGDAVDEPVSSIVTEAAPGVDDPLFDPMFDDEFVDLGKVSLDGVKYFLDVNYTDAPWRTRLGSWTFSATQTNASTTARVEVGALDLTEPEAAEICAALVDYLLPYNPESEIIVSTYSRNDDGTYQLESELLSATAGTGC